MPTPTGMLAPYRVLDLTDARAELATFIFAGLGADVIKVEPPGGSLSRREAPLDMAQPAALASLRFHAYNRGKRSVVFDLDLATDRERFFALVATADFLFENADPGAMEARGLGFESLRAVKPDLVYIAISPFGQTGPYSQHLTTDLTLAAMGGAMALNGDPDRRPVRITVPQTWHHAAAESTVGALAAHHRRVQSGGAQFVDVSVQTAVFWTGLNAMIAHAIQGRNIERNGTILQLSTLVTPLVYPCADGEVVLIATRATLLVLVPWMVESGVVTQAWADAEDWDTYETRMVGGEPITYALADVRAAIIEHTKLHTKAELFGQGIALGVTIAPVNTAADVMTLDQLTVRDFWRELVLPTGRTLRAAGAFVKASSTPVAWTRPAPGIGEHTDEILRSLPTAALREPTVLEPARPAVKPTTVPSTPARLPLRE